MLNRYLSLFALVFILALIVLIPTPAHAELYIACIHTCGYTSGGVLSSADGHVFATVGTLCTQHGEEPYCFPTDVNVEATVEATLSGCSSNITFYSSRAEHVFADDGGDQIFVNVSVGTAAGLAAFIEYRRNVFTGAVIPDSLHLGNNFPGCITLTADTEPVE